MHSVTPKECLEAKDVCHCFRQDATDAIAKKIRDSQICQFELEEAKKFVAQVDATPWYSEPTFVVSGVVVGVSLAGMLGYLLGARK